MGSSQTVPSRRTRAPRGGGDKLRTEILTAAENLLVQTCDEAAVTVRAVANAVGVTPPSIYLHFADKDELLVAVCERNFEELSAAVERAAGEATDPRDALRLAATAYVHFGLARPEQYRILFMRKAGPQTEQMELDRLRSSSGFNLLLDTVQACMQAGLMRRSDPMVVAVVLWSIVHGLTSLMISKPAFEWPPMEEMVDHATRAYLDGLRP
ncbi:MAG: TetR/AcrR family transcriptional regulator [Actinomycetota bacterium]